MIALDRVAEIVIALFVFLVIAILCIFVLIDSSIDMVKARLNSLTVSCSPDPVMYAVSISFEDSVFYCLIEEPNT